MFVRLRPSSLHLHSLRARSLTTHHKFIPVYVNTWDPSKHIPSHPKESSNEAGLSNQDATQHSARKAERRLLRHVHQEQSNIKSTAPIRRCNPSDTYANHTLKRLNYLIGLADVKRNDDDLRAKQWRAYSLAKHGSCGLPSLISDRAWEVLWATQSIRSPHNPSRESHLREIYHDMRSAGKPTTVAQRTEYIESIFLDGETDLALKEWEYDHKQSDPKSRHDYKAEHLEIGARMHALVGNVDLARDLMEELFDLYPKWNPSVMMTVFRAHTSLDSERHHNLAKDIYIKMTARLGKNATLEDYDSWFVGFLEARHLRYAKKVFRDMVEGGWLACDYSPREVAKVLRRLHLLYRLGTDIDKMTSIALHAIAVLPPPWHSELFGHWMQAATTKQAPEAATQILEMMFMRGTIPETFHFNLLLRNLFATKNQERGLKAENIGWHMIEVSRKALELRKESDKPSVGSNVFAFRKVTQSTTQIDIISKKLQRTTEGTQVVDGSRRVPPANSTTFALIMRHHADQLQWEHVDYLARQLNELKFRPDSTILNVLMENQTRQGKYKQAWETYKAFTHVQEGTPGVFPDGANFRHLWLSLRLALSDRETRHISALPTPRELLSDTVRWWRMTRSRWDADRFRTGLVAGDHGAASTLLMHCFSYTKDLPGSLVALHVMRREFNLFPSGKAADVLQKQVAWVDMNRETSASQAQSYSNKAMFTRTMEKMGRVHHILMQNRFKRMNLTGEQFSYLSKTEVGDLNLNVLSEFIRVIMKRQYPAEIVEAMIDEAKLEVGLPGLVTGDMDAFSVA